MSFVFYDTETTGTNTDFDQILQFAAIRTDADFNEIERFEIRSRLLPHVVPAPGAMRVTGITAARLVDISLPSHYEMIRVIHEKLTSWSPAIFAGYNSIEFDEPLFRQALYKTLHSPYLTNTDGNSRSDVMKMAQATSIFVPAALVFPSGEKGPVFKLDKVAPLNGFNHTHAHDALSDVEATIFLCKLISEKAPEVWSSFMRFSQKSAVIDYVSSEAIFCFADVYFGRPYSAIVTSLGTNADNPSEFYIYDLDIDPQTLIGLSSENLAKFLKKSPKPVRRLKSNTSPILMPVEDAPDIAAAKHRGMVELEKRAAFLQSNEEFRQRLIAALESTKEEREASQYVEEQIYDGFFSPADQKILSEFHQLPWEQRLSLVDKLEDQRLRKLGRRLIYTERPDLLSAEERQGHGREHAQFLLSSNDNSPWKTLPQALKELDKFLELATGEEEAFLQEHKKLLLEQELHMKGLSA